MPRYFTTSGDHRRLTTEDERPPIAYAAFTAPVPAFADPNSASNVVPSAG
jgi:hypothetical protein